MRCRRRPANAICALADVFSVPHPIAVHIRVIGRGVGARGRRWVGEARARLREWIRCAVAHGDRNLQHGRRNDPHKQGLHGGLASDTGESHEAPRRVVELAIIDKTLFPPKHVKARPFESLYTEQ